MKAPEVCGGCGKPFAKDDFHRHEVQLAPGHEVRVCSGRTLRYRSESCVKAARKKAQLCPGCGAENQDLGTICADCTAAIERGRTLTKIDLNWHYVTFPYVDDRRRHEAGKLLAKALQGNGSRYAAHGGSHAGIPAYAPHVAVRNDGGYAADPVVEITAAQAEAASALLDLIKDFMAAEYRRGSARGLNLLGGLASGENTLDEINQAVLAAHTKD